MKKVFILDTETTGLNNAEAWEIAILQADETGDIKTGFETTCNPETTWDTIARGMCPYSDEELNTFKTPKQALENMFKYFQTTCNKNKWDNILVIHNASFDMPILKSMCEKYGVTDNIENYIGYDNIVDTMQYLRIKKLAGKWKKSSGLKNIHDILETPEEKRHRAMGDVEATTWLYFEIMRNEHKGFIDLLIDCFKRLIKK